MAFPWFRRSQLVFVSVTTTTHTWPSVVSKIDWFRICCHPPHKTTWPSVVSKDHLISRSDHQAPQLNVALPMFSKINMVSDLSLAPPTIRGFDDKTGQRICHQQNPPCLSHFRNLKSGSSGSFSSSTRPSSVPMALGSRIETSTVPRRVGTFSNVSESGICIPTSHTWCSVNPVLDLVPDPWTLV